MTAVETARRGLLGQIADEIERLRVQERNLEAEVEGQIAQLGDGLDPASRETVILTLRRRTQMAEVQTRHALEAQQQKRADLLEERRDLRKRVVVLRAWLAEREAAEQWDRETLRLLDVVFARFDRDRNAEAINNWRHMLAGIQLPRKADEARAQLRSVERRLDELGEE